MKISEKEIKNIIRKNILSSLLKESASAGTPSGVVIGNLEHANRINVPSNIGDGKGQAIISKNNSETFQFLVPDDESLGILYRADSTDSWSEASGTHSDIIKDFIAQSDQKAMDAYDVANNPITNKMSNLISLSGEDLFKEAALGEDAGSGGIFSALKQEFASTWNDINRQRIKKNMKPVGFIIEASGMYKAKDVNILREPPQGKGDYTSIGEKIGATKDARVFSLSPKLNFDLDKDKAKKIFESILGGPGSYSYYDIYQLSKAFKASKGMTLYKYLENGDALPAGQGVLDDFLQDSAKDKIPLFYVRGSNKVSPVYASGARAGYEVIRTKLLKAYKDQLGSQNASSTSSSETLDQSPPPGRSNNSGTPSPRQFTGSSGRRRNTGGIQVKVFSDSDLNVKGFDDLGFKKGTDKRIKNKLRLLVKNERKFKGTGNINLEVLFNKFGRVSKVKFRKGQSKIAARQVEMLKSSIKSILNNVGYEEYGTVDEWYQDSGVKDRMVPRGKGGRSGSKIDMVVNIF